jgi:hypothetical protein
MATEELDSPQGDENNIRVMYAGAKRRIATLELQLEELRNTGAKQKSCVPLRLASIYHRQL